MSTNQTLIQDFHPNRSEKHEIENNWQGHEIAEIKPPNHTRIMFHNLNGLALNGINGVDMFLQEQQTLEVDLQAFSEHCLDTSRYQVAHKAASILRHNYQGQSVLQLNSSAAPTINTYKPGGTGILILGNMCGRLEPNGRGGDQAHGLLELCPPAT